jgi:hypothetical protein
LVVVPRAGHLWRFDGVQVDGSVRAHTGSIYSISTTNEGILTGGKDGYVRLFNLNLQVTVVVVMMIIIIIMKRMRRMMMMMITVRTPVPSTPSPPPTRASSRAARTDTSDSST